MSSTLSVSLTPLVPLLCLSLFPSLSSAFLWVLSSNGTSSPYWCSKAWQLKIKKTSLFPSNWQKNVHWSGLCFSLVHMDSSVSSRPEWIYRWPGFGSITKPKLKGILEREIMSKIANCLTQLPRSRGRNGDVGRRNNGKLIILESWWFPRIVSLAYVSLKYFQIVWFWWFVFFFFFLEGGGSVCAYSVAQ